MEQKKNRYRKICTFTQAGQACTLRRQVPEGSGKHNHKHIEEERARARLQTEHHFVPALETMPRKEASELLFIGAPVTTRSIQDHYQVLHVHVNS